MILLSIKRLSFKPWIMVVALSLLICTSQAMAQAMSESAYRKLSAAHELLGEDRIQEALAKLKVMEASRLSKYEQALVFQTYGFAYAQLNQYDNAVNYFERCIGLNAMGKEAQHGMLYSLASLYASQSSYQKAIDTLNRWFPEELNPPGSAYMLMASSLFELKRFNDALPYVKKAIAKSTEPPEAWYQLGLSIYFETKDFTSAVALLRKMLGRWPDKLTYWEMLSGAYQQLGKETDAMAATALAHKKGLLTDESKILNLVRMKLYVGVPFEAGELLADELASGRVSKTQKHQALLLNAWIEAKALDNAIDVIDALSATAKTGKYQLQKAQLLTEQAKWQQALTAANEAIRLGNFKKTANAYLIKGMAHAELNQLDSALKALKKAQSLGGNAGSQAEGWVAFVLDKQALQAELAAKRDAAASETP